ncbi:MAG: hypothetical protein ACPLXS_01775 [Candidatus Micrarchaeales archaeon]
METIEIIVIFLGVLYSLLSFVITKKIKNEEKQKMISKRLKELQEKNITQKEREEILKLVNESLMEEMKSMLIVIPIFFIFYYLTPPNFQIELILVSITSGIILSIIKVIFEKIKGGKNENMQE